MAFQKVIPIGQAGSINVTEVGAAAQLQISVGESLGGGQAAGVATASASVNLTVDGKHIVDLGFDYAASKFPAAAALIQVAKSAVDAELAKL